MATPSSSTPARVETLDIMNIGLSVEMFVQKRVWKELQDHPKESMLSSDMDDYPAEWKTRERFAKQRAVEVIKLGMGQFVRGWQIPSLSVWPQRYSPSSQVDTANDKVETAHFNHRIDDLRILAGLHQHRVQSLGAYFADEPEDLIERIFAFFEAHPELPALLVFANDGETIREMVGDQTRKAHWGDGPRHFDSMADSAVMLLLAKRDRVDTFLRPFAGEPASRFCEAGPTKPGYRPSKFLPDCWTGEQIAQFDRLHTLAVLHRPVRISYRKDKEGRPTFDHEQQASVMYPQQQESVFKVSFDELLKQIPTGTPKRLFYDAGPSGANTRVIPLAQAVTASLSEFDLSRPDQGIDLNERVGNTGASSPFVQWALAAITAFEKKESSVTAHLRQTDEALIALISPSDHVPKQETKRVLESTVASQDVSGTKASVTTPTPTSNRYVALGERLSTGDQCPQSGMWRCNPEDAFAGSAHYVPAGRTFPLVRSKRELTAWQKFRNEDKLQNIPAAWTLVSYDIPTS